MCSIKAAIKCHVPANILLTIEEKEGGKPGIVVANKNGIYDISLMQCNTVYLHDLWRYGISPAHVAVKSYYPYDLTAWQLKQQLLYDSEDQWTRAAN